MKETTEYIDELNAEVNEIHSGQKAAGKIFDVTRLPDGTYERRELDPEEYRREIARNFEAKNEVSRLRHRLNLSQKAFAAKLRISVSTLRKWESNATEPSGAAATLLEIIERRPDVLDVLA